jgi:DNA-binding transcriptional MocR family regulator
MTNWRPLRDELGRPAYRGLAKAAARAIDSGELRPGDKLPTHRALSYDLGVSVQTVSRAYDELTRMGLVCGRVGSGTYVRASTEDGGTVPFQRIRREEDVVDCSMLTPVTGPIHAERMAEVLRSMAGDLPADAMFSFRPGRALASHRGPARAWLSRCGLDAPDDRVIATNGCTPAMTVALMTVATAGETVLTERLAHHSLRPLTAALGLGLEGVETDECGIRPDELDRACRGGDARILYLVPSGVAPTATVSDEMRRREIVAVARRHDLRIIENDAGGPLEPDRPPPIAALAPERTLYLTGLTKCLLPALRLGWLVVPDTMIAAARGRHMVTNWMASPLSAELASRWIADGTAEELLAWQRAALTRRNALARSLLGEGSFRALPHGLHLWMPMPGGWSEADFVAHARQMGVALAAGSAFAVGEARAAASGTPRPQGVRISLGGAEEADLDGALRIVTRLSRSQPEPAMVTI